MDITIKRHMIHVDGKRVPYKRSPNGGGRIKVTGQVLHHTASGISPGGDISWLTNRRAKASAHTVIARDGSITQLMPLNEKTWHAGQSSYKGRKNCNGFTIGHEVDNPGHLRKLANGMFAGVGGPYKAEDVVEEYSAEHGGQKYWLRFTDEQIATTIALTVAIHNHYNLDFVTTHYEISPGRKTDIGPHFPMESLRGLLSGREDAAEDQPDGYVSVRSGLNLRAWPSPESKILTTLKNNTPLEIERSGFFNGATWLRVHVGEHEGWVHSGYVDLT